MRFKGVPSGRVHTNVFAREREYEASQIVHVARRNGFVVTRPNGDRRIRGSRRLDVRDARGRIAWRFTAAIDENAPTKVLPIPVGYF